MHRTKRGIGKIGHCRVRAEFLEPANDPHQQNLDAAQRELDSRAAQGEDVRHLWVHPQTYAIVAAAEMPSIVWAVRYIPRGAICEIDGGVCYDVHRTREAAQASIDQAAHPENYEPTVLPPGIAYQFAGEEHTRFPLTLEQYTAMLRLATLGRVDLERALAHKDRR